MVQKTVEAYGSVDCAFNNAGIGVRGRLRELTEDNWDRVIDINLKGVWLCMKYEIAQMLKHGGGAIVNDSSVAGLQVRVATSFAAYVASKHGVVGLTKSAALQYAKEGIRINAVCPGWIDTEMLAPAFARDSEVRARISASQPVGRIGDPREVAEAVLWLCSDAASFVTGIAMPVDGGLVA
jgi:NAD(P)-dependent dehydrogenase (short-subunit alcohol dehydrogenase family)